MNNLTIPRTTARPSFLRRILVTTGVLGALTTGGVLFAGTAAAAELPTTMTAANASMAFPSWCPFGTHGGREGGCRGGSIVARDRRQRLHHRHQRRLWTGRNSSGRRHRQPRSRVRSGRRLRCPARRRPRGVSRASSRS